MPTLETRVPTFWYLFPKASDLQTVLFQCAPDVLLSPYKMWRFEQSGDGQRQLLLAVEHSPLPPQWTTLLKASHIREEQAVMTGDGPCDTSRLRLTLEDATTNAPYATGWAIPLRRGTHLLAALGFEPVPPKTDIGWVLFSLPSHKLRAIISDHFTLNNHELRCSPDHEGRRWLWVRRPELYLVLKCQQQDDIAIFQSFPQEKNLMTPWGYRSVLGGRLRLPQGERLLACKLDGSNESLNTAEWWMASEVITISELPAIQALAAQEGAPKIPVHLRFQAAESIDVPTLWLLEEADAQRLIEGLLVDLPPETRAAISLFVAKGQVPEVPVYILRDDRPGRSAPLFFAPTARGFVPLLDSDGLYIPKGLRAVPTLPPMVWRNALQLSANKITLVFPQPNIAEGMRILQVENQQFAPLEQYVHYQIGAHPEQMKALLQASAFEVAFQPTSAYRQAPAPQAITAPAAPAKTKPQIEAMPRISDVNSQLHVSGREVHTPRLRELETQMLTKSRKRSPIQPRDWVQLASLYNQEYSIAEDPYWLREALKTLDQVLYLDRRAEEAVALEQNILHTLLQLTPGLAFSSLMQQLDQWREQSDVALQRMAFRCRARLILEAEHKEDETSTLHQHFYQDLALVDEALMIREHYIYVAGVAQYLNDQELYERARARYRRLISDDNRLQREMPDILI